MRLSSSFTPKNEYKTLSLHSFWEYGFEEFILLCKVWKKIFNLDKLLKGNLSLYSGCKSCIWYGFCKYCLPVYGLHFHYLNSIFLKSKKFLVLMKYSLPILLFYMTYIFWVLTNLCLTQGHKDFLLGFLLQFYSFRSHI